MQSVGFLGMVASLIGLRRWGYRKKAPSPLLLVGWHIRTWSDLLANRRVLDRWQSADETRLHRLRWLRKRRDIPIVALYCSLLHPVVSTFSLQAKLRFRMESSARCCGKSCSNWSMIRKITRGMRLFC